MISVGIVFYNESAESLNLFFDQLWAAISKVNKENFVVVEIIFVQNSIDRNLKFFLEEALQFYKKQNESLSTILIQNSTNNIGMARKIIVDQATAEWIYVTDPDVLLQDSVFVILNREIVAVKNPKCFGITGVIKQTSNTENLNDGFKYLNRISQYLNMAFQGTSTKVGSYVDHAPTAHMLLNRSIAKEIGNFSSKFSICGEDLDLTHRATQQGCFIYFGSSQVTHLQNFGFEKALKKFFNYGRVQALVFFKNGYCYRRLYRLIPALWSLTVFILILTATKMHVIVASVGLLFTYLLIPQIGIVFLLVLTYGAGTLYGFIQELNALIARAFLREKSKKSLQ